MLNAKIVAEVVVLSFVCGIGFGFMISLCWRDRIKEKKKERVETDFWGKTRKQNNKWKMKSSR